MAVVAPDPLFGANPFKLGIFSENTDGGLAFTTVSQRHLTADIETLLAAVAQRAKFLCLANPDNPTGTYLSAALPVAVVLVIDAAYAEYVTVADCGNGLTLARDSNAENIVVTHTFPKTHDLPAYLRMTTGLPAENDPVIASPRHFMA